MQTVYCHVSKKQVPLSESYKGSELRSPLVQLIQKDHPDFGGDSHIATDQLNVCRKQYVTQLIVQEKGEISDLEHDFFYSKQQVAVRKH